MKLNKLRKWMLLIGGAAMYQIAGCNTLDQYQTQFQDLIKNLFPGLSP